MKKGVTEYYDLTRLHAPNIDPLYNEEIKKNPDIFKRNIGIFSHVYDRAHRNGFIVVPFRKGTEKVTPGNVYNRFTMKNLKRRQEFVHRKEIERLNS